jgi:hypothetical protein
MLDTPGVHGATCSVDYLVRGAIHTCQDKSCDVRGEGSVVGGTGLPSVADYLPRMSVRVDDEVIKALQEEFDDQIVVDF